MIKKSIFIKMFRFFFFILFLLVVDSWIPLTTIDYNRIKTPIFIHNNKYFIDKEYNVYDCNHKKLKTKIENNILWYKEKSTNRMISEVRDRKEKPTIIEVPYEWNEIMSTLFLSIPYSFQKKEISTEKIITHLVEMNHKKFTILFEDKIGKKILNGKVELFSPYLYKLSIRENNEWKVEQILFFIPVTNQKTRLFLYNTEKEDFIHYVKLKKTIKSNHKKIILKWLEKYNPN